MRTSRKLALFASGAVKFDFTYTGTYEFVRDGGKNWRLRFLTSGTFTPTDAVDVDIFAVGGGGGGCTGTGKLAGGGGGYTGTALNQNLTGGTSYAITVGDGGNANRDGYGSSFASLLSVNGGKKAASASHGGAGGSGGAGWSNSEGTTSAVGGSDGGNGEDGASSGDGGNGQGTTTREFGELTGALYAGGGGGMPGNWAGGEGGGGAGGDVGETNTGGGGGAQAAGGSGIVIIRNKR